MAMPTLIHKTKTSAAHASTAGCGCCVHSAASANDPAATSATGDSTSEQLRSARVAAAQAAATKIHSLPSQSVAAAAAAPSAQLDIAIHNRISMSTRRGMVEQQQLPKNPNLTQLMNMAADLGEAGLCITQIVHGTRVWTSPSEQELVLALNAVSVPAELVVELLQRPERWRLWTCNVTSARIAQTRDQETDVLELSLLDGRRVFRARFIPASSSTPSDFVSVDFDPSSNRPLVSVAVKAVSPTCCLLAVAQSGAMTAAHKNEAVFSVTGRLNTLVNAATTRSAAMSASRSSASVAAAASSAPVVASSSQKSAPTARHSAPAATSQTPIQSIVPKPVVLLKAEEGVTRKLPFNDDFVPVHQYKDTCMAILKDILEVADGGENEGWRLEFNKKNIAVYKRAVDGPAACVCVKGTGRVEAPPRAVLDLTLDVNRRNLYDVMFKQGHIVDELQDIYCKVVYLEYEAMWPTAARDFCVVIFIKILTDGRCVLAARSVTHPNCPERKGFVRADAQVTGWVFRPIPGEPMASMVTYITQADLKGNIPAMLVSKVTTDQPLCIDLLRNVIKGVKDHASYIHVPPAPASAESAKEARESPDEEGDEPSAGASAEAAFGDADSWDEDYFKVEETTQAPRASVSSVESNNNNTPLPPHLELAINQALGEVMTEAMYTSDVLPNQLSSEASESLVGTGWKIVGFERGVTLLRKPTANSSVHRSMGKGLIQVPAQVVFEAVRSAKSRPIYDSLVKSVQILQHYEAEAQLVHMQHETTQCLLKMARDFCVVVKARKEATGKFIVAGVSVQHDLCPVQPNIERAEAYPSGWFIEPVDAKSCMVTYVTQVDLKAGVPTRVLDMVAVKQPLCVANLRRHLEARNVDALVTTPVLGSRSHPHS
ncbi:hypothetical protein CAOG_004959 [Capsaspora owczarzaki ATCC 30864]|uniref:START domain-containing protein n=2 Tax=Capsaspora owczarzaki (strain ATCC 30864) TaxID=595528 RepID=A0A0D2VSY0_CAPO3|nr:hypothetical protein CAOG_004959 [Capsaspora owczarzaki ATCC 30864]